MKVINDIKQFVERQYKSILVASLAILIGFSVGVASTVAVKTITVSSYQACLGNPLLQAMNQVAFYKEMLNAKKEDILAEVVKSGLDKEEKEIYTKAVEEVYKDGFNQESLLKIFIGCLNK